MIRRVYVAGAYNAPNIIGALSNMRRGMNLAFDVLKAGYAPFCPHLDYNFSLFGEVSYEEYLRYSMSFLEVCDAVLVVKKGYESSNGTQAEIARATELGIPVFFNLHEMDEYNKKLGSSQWIKTKTKSELEQEELERKIQELIDRSVIKSMRNVRR